MTQQQIIITAAVVVLVAIVIIGILIMRLGRDAGRRRFNARNSGSAETKPCNCQGNGCNCPPPPAPGCIPAVQCNPPYSPPIAIQGLSCDASNDQFVYAGDVQNYVDMMNAQKERERSAASIARLEDAVKHMKASQGDGGKK